ncbi:MAG: type IV secretion protein IcmB [Alphaproteobacteria bacterium]|nr:MAG: type IV secretion protein IcmB [Alphaproteobacteria bacterium]
MLAVVDELIASMMMGLRQPVESFVQLETADDEMTLVASDGSLVSFIRFDGARQIIGDTEYAWIVEQSTLKIGSRFDHPGYALQFYFMRDADRVGRELDRLMRANHSAAKAIGLDLDDLLTERRRHLANHMAWEDIWLVLWTRPSAVSKTDLARSREHRRNISWVPAPRAQFPHTALDALRLRHRSYVMGIEASLEELGFKVSTVDVHEALRSVRGSMYPTRAHDKWQACVPGDPIMPRQPLKPGDMSEILWPSLPSQLCVGDSEVISDTIVRVGDLIWGSTDMILGPADPSPFPQLLARLIDQGLPFRVSFLIESAGTVGIGLRKLVASVLAFTNSTNKQIRDSLETLRRQAQSEPVVRLRLSLSTYAPQGEIKLLESRLSALSQSLESWGYIQASQRAGDPLEGVMSSALGVACASTAVPAIAPLFDVVKLLPWQRASSPFDEGPILFRTPDGRIWPYQLGSSLLTTWFDLIFAQPGSGKSVLMNALSLAACLQIGASRLPYIAILDIGPSSSGLISLLRDSLPPERRYEAMHFKLRMTPEYCVNPFDTQLGCRYPLPEERSYLGELLTLLCTPAGHTSSYDGIPQLVGLCVDEMYRWRDDSGANTEPRPYLARIEPEVDDALKAYNIHLPPDPYWWDVVDALFDVGAVHESLLAQRYAVPTLVDAVTAARRPQIRALLEETQIGASAESVIHAFERMIAAAVREFPILASITKFDIGSSRVCAIDLAEVAPHGDEVADRQTAVMYLLARHALIRSWWFGPDSLRSMPQRFRSYHEARLRDIRETPKRLCYDEFHRTGKTPSVRAQVVRDVREGRKWGVQIVLASQLLDDFSADMVDLATAVWICGSATSERAVSATAERFGLSDTARWVMRNRLTGPRPSGAPVLLLLSTNEGRYEQHLINTLGPIELWALSTSSEDVEIRNRLYSRLGAARARKLLAQAYPGGTARQEIRRRVILRTESGQIEAGAISAVLEEIVEGLAGIYAKEIQRVLE